MLPELTPALIAFIAQHRERTADELLLRTQPMPGVPMAFVAQQVQARRELRSKLPSWVANEQLLFPARVSQEQASSEATALYKAATIGDYLLRARIPARRFADITCGFGVDAVALAQQFSAGVLCERDADLAAVCAFNIAALGHAGRLQVRAEDGVTWLSTQPDDSFDLIYLDPARRDNAARRVSALADCVPDVLQLLPLLLRKASVVLLKAAPMLDIDLACRQLAAAVPDGTSNAAGIKPRVAEVHVVASAGDCKELLFIIERCHAAEPLPNAELTIVAVELQADAPPHRFAFTRSEERAAEAALGMPEAYLYEPHAALTKAGAFRLVGQRYDLRKLHANTHLYTSEVLRSDFPGRIFAIEARGPNTARAARALFADGRAMVMARNAGASADVLRTRLGLRDGGDAFAIACMTADGQIALMRARRIAGPTLR